MHECERCNWLNTIEKLASFELKFRKWAWNWIRLMRECVCRCDNFNRDLFRDVTFCSNAKYRYKKIEIESCFFLHCCALEQMKNINKLKRSIAKRVFYFSITMGDKSFSHLFSLQQLKIKDKFVCFSVNLCVFFSFWCCCC